MNDLTEAVAHALRECLLEHGGFTIAGECERRARKALAAYDARPQASGDLVAVPVRRWPFVETPGQFTARFAKALGHDTSAEEASPGLAAMRTVLIEEPPTLSPEYIARALSRPPQPDTVTDELVDIANRAFWEQQIPEFKTGDYRGVGINMLINRDREAMRAALTAALAVKGNPSDEELAGRGGLR